MKYIILLVALIILSSCKDKNPYDCNLDEEILSFNDSLMDLDDFKKGYEDILSVVDEPDLEQYNTKTYRLMNSHSWDRDIWSYRFEKQNEGGLLTIKKTYTESFKKFKGINDTTLIRTLTSEEWEEIEKVFASNCFWTMPVTNKRRGFDGGMYWLEVYDPFAENPINKKYFGTARWSPEEGTAFGIICKKIYEIAFRE